MSSLMKRPFTSLRDAAGFSPWKYGAACSQSFTPQKPGWRAMDFGARRRMMGALNSSIMTMSHTMPSASEPMSWRHAGRSKSLPLALSAKMRSDGTPNCRSASSWRARFWSRALTRA